MTLVHLITRYSLSSLNILTMAKCQFISLIFFYLVAADWPISTITTISGSFGKLDSWYEKIEVPSKPILNLTLSISLHTKSFDLDEYPYPSPKAYIGLNLNPEETFDYFLDLSTFSATFSTLHLPPANFLIIRIDGGLNSSFPLTPNYSPAKWQFVINAEFFHCSSELFTSKDMKNCDVPVTNSKIEGSWVARIIDVQIYTKEFLVTGKNLTVKKNWFEFGKSDESEIRVLWPKAGLYFVTGFEEINYEMISCQMENNEVYMKGKKVIEIGEVPVGYAIDIAENAASILILNVKDEDIKYLFDFQVAFNTSEVRFEYQDFEAPPALGYLRKGTYLIELDSAKFDFILQKVVMDNKKCSGHKAELINGLVYICDCYQQYTGRNCEVASVSDLTYFTGLLCLTGSNSAMIPALYIGYLRKAYGEIVIFAGNMVASAVYHICDYHYYCFNLQYKFLHTLDFILSYFSVLISFLYLSRIQHSFKLGIICTLFVFLLVVGTGKGFNGFLFEIFVILI